MDEDNKHKIVQTLLKVEHGAPLFPKAKSSRIVKGVRTLFDTSSGGGRLHTSSREYHCLHFVGTHILIRLHVYDTQAGRE